jgi:hypothetical protein
MRTRPFPSSSPGATGPKEQFEDAQLCTDPLDRDDAADDKDPKLPDLLSFTLFTDAPPGASATALRFRFPAILGAGHSSGSKISAIDLHTTKSTFPLWKIH